MSPKKVAALVLVTSVALAGCGGSDSGAGETTSTAGTTATTPSVSTTTTISAEERTTRETARATLSPAAQNIWQKETLTVGIDKSTSPNRSIVPLVEEATQYWETDGREHAEYTINFSVEPNAADPDITVEYVEEVTVCGAHEIQTNVLGCAPVLNFTNRPAPPERVTIAAGYTNESTVETLKHEFGHVFGLTHADEPNDIMKASAVAVKESEPNATDKDLPWEKETLHVYLDNKHISTYNNDRTRQEVLDALEFFNDGAGGNVASELEYVETDTERHADIVIRFELHGGCSASTSCIVYRGYDTDTDPALEYYSYAEITINNVDVGLVAWHVGSWLAFLSGWGTADDLPEDFEEPDYDEAEDWPER